MGDRVREVPLNEVSEVDRHVYTAVFGEGVDPTSHSGTLQGEGPGPNGISGDTWTTWAQVPGLPAAFMQMFQVLSRAPDAALDAQLRELAIVRTALITETKLVYSQHVKGARQSGLSDDKIDALDSWQTSTLFENTERLVLALTDELLCRNIVTEDTFDGLQASLSDRALVELVFTIAFYKMQTLFMRGLELEYEADIRGRLSEVNQLGPEVS